MKLIKLFLLTSLLINFHFVEGVNLTSVPSVQTPQFACGNCNKRWQERFSQCDCKAYGGMSYSCDSCGDCNIANDYEGEGVVIPSGPVTVTSEIEVADTFEICNIRVSLNSLVHTWAGDLNIYITTPWGITFPLFEFPELSPSADFDGTYIFQDDALLSIRDAPVMGGVIVPGTYYAVDAYNVKQNMQNIVYGHSSAGTWTLTIFDDNLGDGGSLYSWTLTLFQSSGSEVCPSITLNSTTPQQFTELESNGPLHNMEYENGNLIVEIPGDYKLNYNVSGVGDGDETEELCLKIISQIGLSNIETFPETYSSVPNEFGAFVNWSNTSTVNLRKGDRIGLYFLGNADSSFTPRNVSLTAVLLNKTSSCTGR